jgi:hypothetical protein
MRQNLADLRRPPRHAARARAPETAAVGSIPTQFGAIWGQPTLLDLRHGTEATPERNSGVQVRQPSGPAEDRTMQRLLIALVAAAPAIALAQTPPAPAPPSAKTLAATMNVYVFPTKGQTASKQSEDEASCYGYAVQNTGSDPFELRKQTQQHAQQADAAKQQAQAARSGAGVRGALGGAAAGALVGEVAGDDAGKGAAVGAAAGAVINRRRARVAESQAGAQADTQKAQADQATAQQLENFKKAFSVCLEAKNYMVKF